MSRTWNGKHFVRWYVWAGNEKIRHTRQMAGTWGYDVQCTCGFATHTGGGTRSWVQKLVDAHKREVGLL